MAGAGEWIFKGTGVAGIPLPGGDCGAGSGGKLGARDVGGGVCKEGSWGQQEGMAGGSWTARYQCTQPVEHGSLASERLLACHISRLPRPSPTYPATCTTSHPLHFTHAHTHTPARAPRCTSSYIPPTLPHVPLPTVRAVQHHAAALWHHRPGGAQPGALRAGVHQPRHRRHDDGQHRGGRGGEYSVCRAGTFFLTRAVRRWQCTCHAGGADGVRGVVCIE